MKKILACIVVLCIGIGCYETGVSPTIKVSVVNDRQLNSDVTKVEITVKNETRSSVYFSHRNNRIGFWGLERKVGNGWVGVDRSTISYSSVYPDGRKVLAPGETLRDSIMMTQAGKYRIGFPFAWDEKGMEIDSLSAEEFVVQ